MPKRTDIGSILVLGAVTGKVPEDGCYLYERITVLIDAHG